MTFEVRFRVEAETDLVEIRKYYLKISESVTDNFFKEFFETLEFIKQAPKPFQERYRGIRIAPLYKFPYGIHYIEKDNQITILRVLHYKRYFK